MGDEFRLSAQSNGQKVEEQQQGMGMASPKLHGSFLLSALSGGQKVKLAYRVDKACAKGGQCESPTLYEGFLLSAQSGGQKEDRKGILLEHRAMGRSVA